MRNRMAIVGSLLAAMTSRLPAQLARVDSAAADSTFRAAVVSSPAPGNRWLVSASVGLPGAGGETDMRLATLGFQFTQLRPRRPGVDLALGTMPYAIANGLFAVAARAGAALPLRLGDDAYVLPSAGVSLIGAAADGGAGGLAGYNVGLALVSGETSAARLRTGVTWHRFSELSRGLWLAEVGIAWTTGGSR